MRLTLGEPLPPRETTKNEKGTMAINADWHRTHVMPPRATPEQRLKWHEAHAKHCGCRPLTTAMRSKLRQAASEWRARRRRQAGKRKLAPR